MSNITHIALVAVVLLGSIPPAAAATQGATDGSFVVSLQRDGAAELTVTTTFDLADRSERDAFEELRDDRQARERFRTGFRDGMAAVAADAENATGREMAITDATIAFRIDGETGVVERTVTWDGLAAVESDSLVVTEPFASGFEPDRTFRVVAPDGYAVERATPTADERDDGSATWNAGTPLDGFAVTVAPSATATTGAGTTAGASPGDGTPTGGTTAGSGAGFGLLPGLAALAGIGLLAARYR